MARKPKAVATTNDWVIGFLKQGRSTRWAVFVPGIVFQHARHVGGNGGNSVAPCLVIAHSVSCLCMIDNHCALSGSFIRNQVILWESYPPT